MMETIPTKKMNSCLEEGSFFFAMNDAYLVLEDGAVFPGKAPMDQIPYIEGEVVFNTGMTGYVESLTDPSYHGQILTFTYPLIGNYGVQGKSAWESKKIQAKGVIFSESCASYHSQGELSLTEWLQKEGIPYLEGIDTRQLTKYLRSRGVMLGAFSATSTLSFPLQPQDQKAISRVSIPERIDEGGSGKKVMVIDCGMKENIMRWLSKSSIHLVRVPYNDDFSAEDFDAVVISNGPGDPQHVPETLAILRKVMAQKKPIFGICLGAQLLALAAGGNTYKLPFGHRGHNQPCQELATKRCFITSQNHGYAIDESSLPKDWIVTFRNLNDGTVEGIRHRSHPFSAVQFHPEAAPGPTDTQWIFEEFINSL